MTSRSVTTIHPLSRLIPGRVLAPRLRAIIIPPFSHTSARTMSSGEPLNVKGLVTVVTGAGSGIGKVYVKFCQ